MNLNDPFQPKPSEISLIFSCPPNGSIKDLRRGLRMALGRYVRTEIAWKMVWALTMNAVCSRDRSQRCIMLTANGSPSVASVILQIHVLLQSAQGVVRTDRGSYVAALEGVIDFQHVTALSSHFMWLGDFLNNHLGNRGERHLLN